MHWKRDEFPKNTKQATIFSKTFRNRWDSQNYFEIDEILKDIEQVIIFHLRWKRDEVPKNTEQATTYSKTFWNRWDSQKHLEIDEILKNT